MPKPCQVTPPGICQGKTSLRPSQIPKRLYFWGHIDYLLCHHRCFQSTQQQPATPFHYEEPQNRGIQPSPVSSNLSLPGKPERQVLLEWNTFSPGVNVGLDHNVSFILARVSGGQQCPFLFIILSSLVQYMQVSGSTPGRKYPVTHNPNQKIHREPTCAEKRQLWNYKKMCCTCIEFFSLWLTLAHLGWGGALFNNCTVFAGSVLRNYSSCVRKLCVSLELHRRETGWRETSTSGNSDRHDACSRAGNGLLAEVP